MTQEIKNILNIFHTAAREVPAYRSFLKANKIDPKKIKMFEDFERLPIMDKHNFIHKYPFEQSFSRKKIPAMISASSGSSGKPTFWPRDDLQEQHGGEIHLRIFRDIFGIKPDQPTLVIDCFATGIWVAGNFTLSSCRYVSRQGYNLTSVTPGIEIEDILSCIKILGPHFKNVIIAGYPPFMMDVFVEAIKRGIKIPKNLKVMTSGDKFSEEWRDAVLKLLHLDGLSSVISVYGCADASLLGFETAASIFLRRKSLEVPQLYHRLFGSEKSLPTILQYDPKYVFFEENGQELIFTANTSIPLIRYNIHDVGNVLTHQEAAAILSEYKLLEEANRHGFKDWQLPFVVKKGRTDVAVTFYALNIYPEDILAGIEDRRVKKFLTGDFFSYNQDIKNHKQQKLFIKLQLSPKTKLSAKIKELIGNSIVENLKKTSTEYRKLFAAIGNRALPEILFTKSKDFKIDHHRGLIDIQGKKPKVTLGEK
ncbi:MAG: hypothetical protein ABI643_01735 [Candidatus Doudnabacteria bacterium]